jgi:hypothetical protein
MLKRQNSKARCQTFEIPFPRAWNRFVEIVQIKNYSAPRLSVYAKVLKMGVSAHLDRKLSPGELRQI